MKKKALKRKGPIKKRKGEMDLELETPLTTRQIKEVAEIIFYDHITTNKELAQYFSYKYRLTLKEIEDLLKIRKNLMDEDKGKKKK